MTVNVLGAAICVHVYMHMHRVFGSSLVMLMSKLGCKSTAPGDVWH